MSAAAPPNNAFAVLMGSCKTSRNNNKAPPAIGVSAVVTQRSRRYNSGTEFVPCPAGCGKRMLEKEVNSHLDQCIGKSSEEKATGASNSSSQQLSQLQQQSPGDLVRIQQKTLKGSAAQKKRRVICPACEKSFPSSLINLHLDQCVREGGRAGRVTDGQLQIEKQPREREEVTVSKKSSKETQQLVQLVGDNIDDFGPEDPPCPNGTSVVAASSPETATKPNTRANGSPEAEISARSSLNNLVEISAQSVLKSDASNPDVSEAVSTVPESQQEQTDATASQSREDNRPSVFAKMMKQSKTVVALEKAAVATTLHQTFRLDDNIGVALNLRGSSADREWTRPSWSALVNIKDRLSRDAGNPVARPPLAFEVTLFSSIPSHGEQVRWVRQHSRLSVPVLKSILQKAVRRRRPLPAVRVAMELADKSLGDLLRRLPVIILEDSTLHPDIDFLVWIMMAHSKDFVPPPRLMIRVFQIVYEVASCQWSDPISSEGKEGDEPGNMVTSLTSLFERSTAGSSSSSFRDAVVWSMLVRAEYGGMRCDVHMLQSYAKIWNRRFELESIPDDVPARLYGSTGSQMTTLKWSDVPTQIHQRAREQGIDRVSALCTNTVDRLVLEDICLEGVDFHCSPVIDELLTDHQLCGICHDLIGLANSGTEAIPVSAEGRRSWLEGILKRCMWDLSSGVNRRRPLLSEQPASSTKNRYSELWNELVAQRALSYQKKYVEQRLAR